MISPALTFEYHVDVQNAVLPAQRWSGQGFGQASFGNVEGLAGPKPRFELDSGWLALFPTSGWARSFPIHHFSDQPRRYEMDENTRRENLRTAQNLYMEAQKASLKEAAEKFSPKENFNAYMREQTAAFQRALRQRGMMRDFVSFSLFVGASLDSALRAGDELVFLRDANGDFRYGVKRNSETVFSAGTVARADPGGPMGVWQEYDQHPNPNAESLKKQYPSSQVAEWIPVHRPYVTARIQGKHFHLVDGQEALIDPYYIFLARSNQKVPAIAFEFTPRAVHSAGRLDLLSKDEIIDAAQNLNRQHVRLL